MRLARPVVVAALLAASACSDARRSRPAAVTPLYDPASGRLVRLAQDRNSNGVADTFTAMNGPTPVSSTIDQDEDGRPDRWEYYDAGGRLLRVGYSRHDTGAPDAWAYSRADGTLERIEISSSADESKIDRREFYAFTHPDVPPVLARAEEDADGDGHIDKWEEYDEGGQLRSASWASAGRTTPDRRVTWRNGVIVLIESEPDANGSFQTRVEVK